MIRTHYWMLFQCTGDWKTIPTILNETEKELQIIF